MLKKRNLCIILKYAQYSSCMEKHNIIPQRYTQRKSSTLLASIIKSYFKVKKSNRRLLQIVIVECYKHSDWLRI